MRRNAVPVTLFAALAAGIAVLPAFLTDFRAQQFAYVGIYLIALIGLNVLTGYTGQMSLGHGAFMAVGGYTTAILMTDHGVKDLWTIPIAAVVGGLLLGVALNLLGTYVNFVGADLRLPAALAVILGVLLFRPAGLFGHRVVKRV